MKVQAEIDVVMDDPSTDILPFMVDMDSRGIHARPIAFHDDCPQFRLKGEDDVLIPWLMEFTSKDEATVRAEFITQEGSTS